MGILVWLQFIQVIARNILFLHGNTIFLQTAQIALLCSWLLHLLCQNVVLLMDRLLADVKESAIYKAIGRF